MLGALGQSTSALKGAVAILQRALPGGTKEPKRVEDAVESVRAEEERQISGVVDLLQQRLGAVPEEHFRSMRERFLARLG